MFLLIDGLIVYWKISFLERMHNAIARDCEFSVSNETETIRILHTLYILCDFLTSISYSRNLDELKLFNPLVPMGFACDE